MENAPAGFDELLERPFRSLIENAKIYDDNAKAVARHIVSWFQQMNMLEQQQVPLAKRRHTTAELDAAIAQRVEVFHRFWNPKDDYWLPCSIDSEVRYNPLCITALSIVTDGNGGFVVTLAYEDKAGVMASRGCVYLVEAVDGAPKIVNEFY